MKHGDRVEIHARWSSFYGMAGTVTQTTPFLMIVVDGDSHPIRVGESEVTPIPDEPHMVAGE